MSCINVMRRDAIAILNLNCPPVNGLGQALRREVSSALEALLIDECIAGLVITGTVKFFSAGADMREFGRTTALASPSLLDLIIAIESSKKPVVAAIQGICLGGGLELALACHARVAHVASRLGVPEVKLGLLPGAGGTQRLPRAVGLGLALDMIVSGETKLASELAHTALFAVVAEHEILEIAIQLARRLAISSGPLPRLRDLQVPPDEARDLLLSARTKVLARYPREPARLRCVEAVSASLASFEAGLRVEREAFESLMLTPESQSLRHAFFAERAANRIADVSAETPRRPIKTIGIIGAGTMGVGISMSFLNAGLPVTLVDSSQTCLGLGVERIRENYAAAVNKGKLKPEELDARLGLLRPSLSLEDLSAVDLLIEAVFEDMDIKRALFARLDAVAKPGAILASNTSTLDLDVLAASTQRPHDVVGLHFFSPAHVMRLLEVVRGKSTGKDVLATVMHLSRMIRKAAVVSGVCDGFIGNRMLEHYVRMAHCLVEEGASPWEVDEALESWGMAMGPFRMGDMAGNDIGWAIRKRRYIDKPHVKYSRIADRLCDLGRFGQKTGAGWYRYEPGQRRAVPDPVVDLLVADYRREIGVQARRIEKTEIVERCIYALVNEGARIVQEGIAQRASDLDVVYLSGYGFPAWRGGPMFFADTVGLSNVMQRMRQFAGQEGGDADFWQPASYLVELAERGVTFTDRVI